jgi:hypothetical protein
MLAAIEYPEEPEYPSRGSFQGACLCSTLANACTTFSPVAMVYRPTISVVKYLRKID